MTKRKLAWISATIFAATAVLLAGFGITGTQTMSLGVDEIQKRIDAQLPKTFKTERVTGAELKLREKDLEIQLAVEGRVLTQQFSLTATGTGVPVYHDQAFFFKPTKLLVSRIELTGGSVTDKATQLLDRYVTDSKIHDRIKGALPGIKNWVDDNFESHALALLERTPLYTPKSDFKGTIIKASLESVNIVNGKLEIKFSLLKLTGSVLFGIIILLGAIAMTGALIMCPEWGAVPLFIGALS